MAAVQPPPSPDAPAPPEVPVWLELNGRQVWTWLCTPICLEPLACGWLIAEGRISAPDQITHLDVSEGERSVNVRTTKSASSSASPLRTLSTGPGKAAFSLERVPTSEARSIADLGSLIESGRLRVAFQEMFAACPLRAMGGGIHSGALLVGEKIMHVHEDVGRHNVMDKVIGAAARREIGILPVFFDGVWNPHPAPGPQPEPRPRVHNSGWVQSPGAAVLSDPERQDALEPYVSGVVGRFRDDPRIDGWDLFNEPDNPNPAYREQEIADKPARALELLGKAFAWARAVDPSQPLTTGLWQGSWGDPDALSPVARLSLDASDVVSLHCYGDLADLRARVEALRRTGRPLLCTEFMARTLGSTFDPHLGWMKQQGVGAYCWGFVAGRIQTEYPWDSWVRKYEAEPEPWFHDLLRPDGSPYDAEEVAYVRSQTGAEPR